MAIKETTTRNLIKNFKKFAANIYDYNDVVVVARPDNKNVVLVSEQEFNSWQETNYLLSTANNRLALQRGMSSSHSSKKLTPEEWDKMAQNDGKEIEY